MSLILEVGLGGRLDAVNIVDADVAVLTSVDLDHVDYLGATREAIGREKAGIFRAGPAGDLRAIRDPPRSVRRRTRDAIGAHAAARRPRLRLRSRGQQWRYFGPRRRALRPAASRRCAARISSATRRPRSPRSTACATALPVAARRDSRRARRGRAAGPLPGAARTADDRARRRAQSARRARARAMRSASMGFHPRDDRGVRHARRQGHRRRGRRAARRASTAGTSRRCPARAARRARRLRERCVAAGVDARDDPRRSTTSSAPTQRRATRAGEADRIVVFGSFLTVAAALARGACPRDPTSRSARMAEPTDLNVDELRRRARRRLVGAIVLALAAAVVVPMLLETDPKPLGEDVSVKIPPVDDGKFVNRLNDGEQERSAARLRRRASATPQKSAPTPKARCGRRRKRLRSTTRRSREAAAAPQRRRRAAIARPRRARSTAQPRRIAAAPHPSASTPSPPPQPRRLRPSRDRRAAAPDTAKPRRRQDGFVGAARGVRRRQGRERAREPAEEGRAIPPIPSPHHDARHAVARARRARTPRATPPDSARES